MSLIAQFENMPIQNVKTFNKVFKTTPIIGVADNVPVEILELMSGDERKIKVGEDFIRLCLVQRKTQKKRITKNYKITIFKSKECSKCKKTLPFSMFSPHRSSKGGVRAACKKCCINETNAWKLKTKLRKEQQIV